MADDILTRISRYKLEEIATAKATRSYADVETAARAASPVRGFITALRAAAHIGLIAEIKKASPSKGLIRADFDPVALARAYATGGATCLSVLTDAPSFQGAPEYLTMARNATQLPVLRKDFIYDPYQIAEARSLAADAILLIMATLSDAQAQELSLAAQSFGMDVLFEVHNAAELNRALALSPQMIGINNRNLHTFETDLATTHQLIGDIPDGILCVSESGINSSDDVKALMAAGVAHFLVGESLMRQDDVATATQELMAM